MIDFIKTSLSVKPPLKNYVFTHKMIFPKTGIWRGGVTLVPEYEMQPQNHQALPSIDAPSFIVVRKS